MKKVRHILFLKDVSMLALTSFGGPQAHLALFFKVLVKKRNYLSEEELIDLNSFCQILPGPASTQTLTAVGFKLGGPRLAFLTLLIWILPAATIMTIAGIFISHNHSTLHYTKYVQIIAVGFVVFAAYRIASFTINSSYSVFIFILSVIACYFIPNPVIFPLILLAGGLITSFRYKKINQIEEKREKLKIEWSNLVLFVSVFLGAAILGHYTRELPDSLPISLPIRLFENCFRYGTLTFGGGEALIALFNKQFVEFRHYLTNQEFLSGYGLLKSLPGPLFSFSAFIGTMAMEDYGIWGQIIGSITATAGIFLPGTILIFFVIRFWDQLKQYRIVKASLEGINAASAGIVTATAVILSTPLTQVAPQMITLNFVIVAGTFILLVFTKIPSAAIIFVGLAAGFIF